MRREATGAFKVEIDVLQEKKTCMVLKGDRKCCNIKIYRILRMNLLEFTTTPHLTKGVLLEHEGDGLALEKVRTTALQFLDQATMLSATSTMVVRYSCANNALP